MTHYHSATNYYDDDDDDDRLDDDDDDDDDDEYDDDDEDDDDDDDRLDNKSWVVLCSTYLSGTGPPWWSCGHRGGRRAAPDVLLCHPGEETMK